MRRLSLIGLVLGGLAGGCGGGVSSGGGAPTPKGRPDPAAQRVAQAYVDAYAAKQPRAICHLLAASVVAQLGGARCAKTVKGTLKYRFPKLHVMRSYVTGSTAEVTFRGTQRVVTLTRERNRWKVINGGT